MREPGEQRCEGTQGAGLPAHMFLLPVSTVILHFGPAFTVFLSRTPSNENWLDSWVSPLDSVPELKTFLL